MQVFHCRVPSFLKCLLVSFLVRPDHVFSKPCLMSLVIIEVVGINSAEYKYFASYSFDVCDIILFILAAAC